MAKQSHDPGVKKRRHREKAEDPTKRPVHPETYARRLVGKGLRSTRILDRPDRDQENRP